MTGWAGCRWVKPGISVSALASGLLLLLFGALRAGRRLVGFALLFMVLPALLPLEALLAKELDADLFIMATDVDGVYTGWGTPDQKRLDKVTPLDVARHAFPAGSMGPKVAAASLFAERTGNRAAIGSLEDIEEIVTGTKGTSFLPDQS